MRRSPSSGRTSLSSRLVPCGAGARGRGTLESLGPTQCKAREGQGEAVGTPGLLSAFTQSPQGRAAAAEPLRTGHHLNGTKFPGKIPLESVPSLCAMRTHPPGGEPRLFPTPHVPTV